MNERRNRFAEKRRVLVEQAATERILLADSVEPWRAPLRATDLGLRALKFVKSHPAWIIGSALLPGALRPGPLGTWLRRGLVAFQMVNRLRSRPSPRAFPPPAN